MKTKNPKAVLVGLMLQQCILAVIGALWIVWMSLATSSQLALTVRSVLLGLALAGVLIGLAYLAQRSFPAFMDQLNETVVALWRKIGIRLTPGIVVLLALGAGIGEELLFRGALQSAVMTFTGPWTAVIVASLIFGALHAASMAYFIAAAAIGGVLGMGYYLSGSLIAVMIAHTVYDIWALNRLASMLDQR